LIEEGRLVPTDYLIVPRMTVERFMLAWKDVLPPDDVSTTYRGAFLRPTAKAKGTFARIVEAIGAHQYRHGLHFMAFGEALGITEVRPGDIVVGNDWVPVVADEARVVELFEVRCVIPFEQAERFWGLLRQNAAAHRRTLEIVGKERAGELTEQWDSFVAQNIFGAIAAPPILALRSEFRVMVRGTEFAKDSAWLGGAMFHRDIDDVTAFE
jgi:hypothetical protein